MSMERLDFLKIRNDLERAVAQCPDAPAIREGIYANSDLVGEDLSRFTLRCCDFSNSDLRGATFPSSTIACNFEGAKRFPEDPPIPGWFVKDGVLCRESSLRSEADTQLEPKGLFMSARERGVPPLSYRKVTSGLITINDGDGLPLPTPSLIALFGSVEAARVVMIESRRACAFSEFYVVDTKAEPYLMDILDYQLALNKIEFWNIRPDRDAPAEQEVVGRRIMASNSGSAIRVLSAAIRGL